LSIPIFLTDMLWDAAMSYKSAGRLRKLCVEGIPLYL